MALGKEIDVDEVLGSLKDESAEELLISLVHFGDNSGGQFESVQATSGLDEENLKRLIPELSQKGLLEIGVYSSADSTFIKQDGGDRFRLVPDLKAALKRYVL